MQRIAILFSSFIFCITCAQGCFDSNDRPGECVNLARCPHLLEEFYQQARVSPNGFDFQTFVSQSLCGFDGMNFLICCTIRRWGGGPSSLPLQSAPSNPWYGQPSSSLFHFAALSNQIEAVISPTVPTSAATTTSTRPTPSTIRPVTPTTLKPTITTKTPTIINPVPGSPSFLLPVPLKSPSTRSGECGISGGYTNRVVGGLEAKRGSYPWVAALGYYELPDPNLKFFCGGSLISHTFVITSAHCINPALTIVRLGAHDVSKIEANAIDVRIKRQVVHEKFDLKTISNDIALIELSNGVVFTDFIRPICLPEDSKFMQQDFVGSNPFVAGWGSVQYQGVTSTVLRDAQVPVVQTKTCLDSYSKVFTITENPSTLICAGNSRLDACQGDSGGPLMMPQLEGKIFRYYLIGLVSYGYECARAGFPGVYTRVAAYMQWVKKNMS